MNAFYKNQITDNFPSQICYIKVICAAGTHRLPLVLIVSTFGIAKTWLYPQNWWMLMTSMYKINYCKIFLKKNSIIHQSIKHTAQTRERDWKWRESRTWKILQAVFNTSSNSWSLNESFFSYWRLKHHPCWTLLVYLKFLTVLLTINLVNYHFTSSYHT